VITQDVLINIRFSDRADKDRQGKTDTAPATQSSPDTAAADSKTKIDRLEGSVTQTKQEDSTGAGKANARDDWYNSSAQRPGNSVLSAASGGLSETDLDTLSALSSVTQAEALGQASTKSKETADAEGLLYSLTGSPTAAITGSPAPESAKTTDTTTAGTNEKTGLPRQEIGAIDLIDGRAEAVTIQDESRRVKGYESSATIITTPEALTIAPGSIIGLSRNCVPQTFAREWRVGQVKHSLQPGQFRTSLDFYTPQASKAGDLARDFSLAATPTSPVKTPPGRMLNPLIGTPRGTPYDPGGAIRDYPHNGIDLSNGGGQNVCAAEAGVVDTAGNAYDGYGNAVFIKHTGEWNGWGTLYAHLASISVSPGQTVTKGQVIGVEGNTGGYGPGEVSGGTHLHFELWRPDGGREDPEVYICPRPTGVYGQGTGYPIRSKC
jgi:murein DD-endopeptidase MepM/ murein hydrolase activator NlpD